METNNNDIKLLSIMEFIHYYDPDISIQTLINGASFTVLLSQVPASEYDLDVKININKSDKNSIKWSQQLQNLQAILFKIENYFENVHCKSIETSHLDLIAIAKRNDLHQLVKYFQLVMAVLMESTIKESVIQIIMTMQESSQEIFVEIVKNCLNESNFVPSKYKSNIFNRVINELQQQKHAMQKQIERLCKANDELLTSLKKYQQSSEQLNQSDLSMSIDEGKNVKYLQQYIDQLQSRIVQISRQQATDRTIYEDTVEKLQECNSKLEEAEELCKIYKEKYDDIMDQMQKMNIWKREKAKMEKVLEEKDFIILKLNDRIEELSQKNLVLEDSTLDLKMDLDKKQIKILKMSNQLRKVMQNIGSANTSILSKLNQSIQDQSIREYKHLLNQEEGVSLCYEDELTKAKKQIQKLKTKCKQSDKELTRLNKKIEKFRLLEEEKNKLEQLVFQLRITQSEELNLMMAVFFDSFEEQFGLMKDLRRKSTFSGDNAKVDVKPRSRGNNIIGSSMFKLKQNSKPSLNTS